MKVEIFSDVACHWCYISKRRFEAALAGFEHRDQVEITWGSYQLDPSAPRTTETALNELVADKTGMSLSDVAAASEQVSALAAKEGLEFHMEKVRYGNTFDAHRLLQFAATHNLQEEVEERLFKAYFTEGAALGDTGTLVKLVSEVGLEESEIQAILASDKYADKVRADIRRASHLGIQAVPFYVIDEKYGISGAQPVEVLQEKLEQAWTESHPLITVSGGSQNNAGFCEGDSCAIA